MSPRTSAPGTAGTPGRSRRRPLRSTGTMLPRPLPWESPLTRMWPGTKVLCLTLLTSVLLLRPDWLSVALVAVAMAIGSLVARVPASALPILPSWLWGGIVGGMVGAGLAGGFWIFVRSLLVAALVLWGSMLLVWTTPPERLVPAFRVLMTPLGWLRLPVDEWAATMGLALRGIPTLRDENAAVLDTARLRLGGKPPESLRSLPRLLFDIVTASLSASSRRASDTGRAMTLRGGTPPVPRERVRPGWGDGVALVVVGAAVALVVCVWTRAIPDPLQLLGAV